MTVIGLDLSINCTGVCIVDDIRSPRYFIIPSKTTKKMKSFRHNRVEIMPYTKEDNATGKLSLNIKEIASKIEEIISTNRIDLAVIEDTALAASGRVVDLAILNGYVRCLLDRYNIPFITPRPTQWKKEMIGNGMADKKWTIQAWKSLDPIDYQGIKIDDCADAFFLASYGKIFEAENDKN